VNRLRIVILAATLAACGSSAVPALSDAERAWCGDLANASAVISQAKALGVDPARDIFVSDYLARDGYRRACRAAFQAAHP
jgi:hypothetical protein